MWGTVARAGSWVLAGLGISNLIPSNSSNPAVVYVAPPNSDNFLNKLPLIGVIVLATILVAKKRF